MLLALVAVVRRLLGKNRVYRAADDLDRAADQPAGRQCKASRRRSRPLPLTMRSVPETPAVVAERTEPTPSALPVPSDNSADARR